MDRLNYFKRMLFLFSILFSLSSLASFDWDQVLFGVEYSFQDQEIVNEPGRATMTTPYKTEKMNLMLAEYLQIYGLSSAQVQTKHGFKGGVYISVPGDGDHVLNTEPVTVELNTTPKRLSQITGAAVPVFKAAHSAGLQAYVNPAGERSGMGHIHVGGQTLGENPFVAHEHLLRNVMAYYHKNPALMYGFAEAYDLGMNSNIESYHQESRQKGLAQAVELYDQDVTAKLGGGVLKFLKRLKAAERSVNWMAGKHQYISGARGDNADGGFFHHYRFINLEHISSFSNQKSLDLGTRGKYTVEFRNFRPPKSPEQAHAMAELLMKVMQKQSIPDHLEKFEYISPESYALFMTGTKIQSNWESVRKELGLDSSDLDSMVEEYVTAIHAKQVHVDLINGMEIFEAYSEKGDKGTRFEIRLDARLFLEKPQFSFNDQVIYFEHINVQGKSFWVGLVDTKKEGIKAHEFYARPMKFLKRSAPVQGESCRIFYAG